MKLALKSIHRKRLLKVAQALREASNAAEFNMAYFGLESADHESCGTPACALGHYAARRDLQKTFKLDMWGELVTNLGMPPHGVGGTIFFTEGPIASHFGLDVHQMEELFGSNGCGRATSPVAAAKYIEKFVRNYTP